MHKEHLKGRDLEPSGNRKKQNKSHLGQHFHQSIYRIIIEEKKKTPQVRTYGLWSTLSLEEIHDLKIA